MDIIVNEHISLKRNDDSAIPYFIKYLNDPTIYANTLKVPSPYNESDGHDFLKHCNDFEAEHGKQKDWGIYQGEELIGGIGLLFNHGVDSHKSEIGYWLAAPFRGQGIMTQVVNRFASFCFNDYKLVRLEAQVFFENPASAKVLEKAGFKNLGLHRKAHKKDGAYQDALFFERVSAY